MKIKQLLNLALLAIVSLNCKKDNVDSASFLLDKSWKRGISDKNIYSNPSGRILYAAVSNCQQDDIYDFKPDGTLSITKGTERCNVVELASEVQTYSYNKRTKELTINGIKYKLAEESEDQIKYFAALPAESGSDYMVFLLE